MMTTLMNWKKKNKIDSTLLSSLTLHQFIAVCSIALYGNINAIHRLTGVPLFKKAARHIKNRCCQENFSVILKNWDVINTTFESLYGRIKIHKIFMPNNRKYIKKMFIIFKRLYYSSDMKATISRLCSKWRKKSLGIQDNECKGLGTRGKTRISLFIASTLSRAVLLPRPSTSEIENEVKVARERLTQEKKVIDKDTKDELDRFIKEMLDPIKDKIIKNMDLCALPLPALAASINNPSRNGGASEVLSRYRKIVIRNKVNIERFVKMQAAFQRPNLFDGPVPKRGTGRNHDGLIHKFGGPDKKKVMDILKAPPSPTPEPTIVEIFEEVLTDKAEHNNKIKLFPLITSEGKIRVPTMNSSEVVWAARTMQQCLLPIVKSIGFTRSILRNKRIHLRSTQRNTFLYSADFSKSTDEIGIDTSKFVLSSIVKHLGKKPKWWDKATELILKEFEIEGTDDVIKCGALMGLGPSWTILCILNAFATRHVSPKSVSICGDDLIGLWTREEIAKYEEHIEDLGLVLNKSKSYISPSAGVFCEKLVERVNSNYASSISMIRLSQAAGSRAIDKRKGTLIVDVLNNIHKERDVVTKPIAKLCKRTVRKFCIDKDLIPGPYRLGGQGFGRINEKTFFSFLMYGPVNLVYHQKAEKDPAYEKIRTALKHANRLKVVKKNEPLLVAEDVKTSVKSIIETNLRLKDKLDRFDAKQISLKNIRAQLEKRNILIRSLVGTLSVCKAFEHVIRNNDNYTADLTENKIKNILFFLRKKRFGSALQILQNSWKYKIGVGAVEAIIKDSSLKVTTLPNLNGKAIPPKWDSTTAV